MVGEYSKRTRNPIFIKICPVHDVALIKDTVVNEIGAWSSISFNKNQTPYPRVGISVGCTGTPPKSIIKYCSKCGNGH